ncbi:MAG: DUF695 domain-containing protein [Candidatus Sumerlaeia bacterium]|nr:DUF695 domain-containing protein [Candidatus Sumerlaeia bacterium]
MPPRAIGCLPEDELVRFTRPMDEGRLVYVTTNPRVLSLVQRGGYATRVFAIVSYEIEDSDGLPSEDQALALNTAEEEFLSLGAGQTMSLLQVGRLTYHGNRVLVFHSSMQQPLGQGPSFSVFIHGVKWDIYYEQDQELIFLRTVMEPTAEERRASYNQTQIARLEDFGDPLAKPRPLRFFGTFPSLPDMAGAIAMLNDKQFRCEDQVMREDRSWTMVAAYDCAPDPTSVERLTGFVQYICHLCNGHYEGWDCEARAGAK